MNTRIHYITFAIALLVLVTGSLQAQQLDASGIKAKYEESVKAREASRAAYGQNNAEEGENQAKRSATLLHEARDEYDSINAGESDDIELLLDYAHLLNEMSDYDLSEKVLLRAVKLAPDDAMAWLRLGQTQAALGSQRESLAIISLRRAIEVQPPSNATVEANASLGSLYQQAGLYEFAREAYTRALEQDANHTGAKLAVAALDAREGQMVKAEEAFDSIESLSPDYGPFIKRTLGAALAEFDQSRRWLDDTAEMHFAYAELLIRVDRIEDSFLPLNRSLRIDDQNYIAWNLMGSVMRALERLRGSREAFMRSLELNPDQPRTREALEQLDVIEAEKPGSTIAPPAPATTPPGEAVPGAADVGQLPSADATPPAEPQPAADLTSPSTAVSEPLPAP